MNTEKIAMHSLCNVKYNEKKRGELWVQFFTRAIWVQYECVSYDSGSYASDYGKFKTWNT